MLRDNLNDLVALSVVVKEGSFTKAARQLGVSQSALSHAVKGLEDRLGTRLLSRSTRSLYPTDAGRQLLKVIDPSFASIQDAITNLGEWQDNPSGTVKIISCRYAAHALVWPRLRNKLNNYPNLHIELLVDNRVDDIIAEHYDMGIRIEQEIPKDMISFPISEKEGMVIAGSPEYLDRYGYPQKPEDLLKHNCIKVRKLNDGRTFEWILQENGKPFVQKVNGQWTFSDNGHAWHAALDGAGLAYLPYDLFEWKAREGRLVQVLKEWMPLSPGFHLFYPNRRHHSRAFSLVLEALKSEPTA
ncbi:LysR family transcriptional regulator [Alteromonas lipolytica]|uniref:HTH lysR-type domain-containing protein n=1 Tax=Alteromonas lipolytica TaxID=1856405 RepID=A0A1E8FKI4_9ALTE|nr:LysR family transcriptional regulator [Alteromonas lipolytica]OFI36266.1 hypothetical protein BFC17_09095 [Alteromonas lipolytica]GGF79232.1 LysR family transcriptional regulator [Alteromonas lipolytica]